MIFAKEIAFIISLFALLFMTSSFAYGAEDAWSTCPSGKTIARCQTINCREGDTNKDGACTLADKYAELTDSRNDALCSNPPSGCGEVLYYEANATTACIKRVKEAGTNCSLYSTSTPRFGTPTPTSTPTSNSKFTLGATSTPKPTTKPILPATGPSPYVYPILATLGLAGLAVFFRFR